jgi:hypothetical protein
MGNKRLPWFKVQTNLTSHPKFRLLSAALRGHLLSLWCCASDQPVRGKLPSLRDVAYHLGPSYYHNTLRIENQVYKPLIDAGFLESRPDGIYIHDWEYWQAVLSPQVFPQSVVQSVEKSVDAHVENKGDKPIITQYREIEGKNRAASPLPQAKVSVKLVHDPRYEPLKISVTELWEKHRQCSITSCTVKKDWVQFSDMLKRSVTDKRFTLEALTRSFTAFISSNRPWEKSQGLGYWALNAYRYMSNGNSANTLQADTSVQDENDALEWWKRAE